MSSLTTSHAALITWAAFGLAAGLAALLLYLGLLQDRSRGRPRCPKCWYNMTGAPSLVCPECGHDARSKGRLYRTRRWRWPIIGAAVLAGCCAYLWLVRIRAVELHEPVDLALRPTSYLLSTLTLRTPPAQLELLTRRVDRFGLWPWEERLLLLTLEPLLSSASPSFTTRWLTLQLLGSAARTSDRALDRLVELCERPNASIRQQALRLAAQHADRLRDSQLTDLLLDSMTREVYVAYRTPIDGVLLEMVRRNHRGFREKIARWATAADVYLPFGHRWNLEFLTALRRMEGKPDPLHIFVSGAPIIECAADHLPTINVTLKNVDVGREAVGFAQPEYPTDRQARWRLEVRDERGRLMPIEPPPALVGRQSFRLHMLEAGQSYATKLDITKHVRPLSPGRYRVVVQHHNSEEIGALDPQELSHLILFSSDPFELIVKPPSPATQPADTAPASQPAEVLPRD